MPKKSRRPCAYFTCANLTENGNKYCKKHSHLLKKEKATRNKFYDKKVRDKKINKFYHSTEWEKARLQALIRDKGLCQHCLKENEITLAEMVYHIIPIKKDWSKRLDLNNLISLCNKCHNKLDH